MLDLMKEYYNKRFEIEWTYIRILAQVLSAVLYMPNLFLSFLISKMGIIPALVI